MPDGTRFDGRFPSAEKAEKWLPSTGAAQAPQTHSELLDQGMYAEKAGYDTSSTEGEQSPSNPTASLVFLHRRRRFVLKQQMRIDRACEAFLAQMAGYTPDMPEKQRTALWKQVSAVRKAVERGSGHIFGAEKAIQLPPSPRKPSRKGSGEGHLSCAEKVVAWAPSPPSWANPAIILASAQSRAVWDEMRKDCEKQICAIVRKLPVWSAFAVNVRGLGELGVGLIIGEAGGLESYPSKGHLWKRMGLAVIDGERQQKKSGAEMAALHGYNPSRRSTMFVLADSLFRAQWRKQEGAETGSPAGPYGEAYAHRRACTAAREGWSAAHQHADALRYMSKKLLAHLRAAAIKEAQ